jgi:hypothetical protein
MKLTKKIKSINQIRQSSNITIPIAKIAPHILPRINQKYSPQELNSKMKPSNSLKNLILFSFLCVIVYFSDANVRKIF